MKPIFAKDLRWLKKWEQRCLVIGGHLEQGKDSQARELVRLALIDLDSELGEPTCTNHPDGCPNLPNESVEDAFFCTSYIITRVEAEVIKAIILN